ncbi:MAG TPA: hypothetical protein VHB79_09660 [Polyangiaceae bacterium]|nr:hypothetical protein [Polyangiaceae bacterium]
MSAPRFLIVSAAVALFAISASAAAQSKEDNYSYEFKDEKLLGSTLSTTPPLLTVRPRAMRVTLLRPRAAFVGELLKSVEAL